MGDIQRTQYFKTTIENPVAVDEVLKKVYVSLAEKGYNPVNQLVGYIMSGDPTYITSYGGARSLIMKADRDELLEELVQYYIDSCIRGEDSA